MRKYTQKQLRELVRLGCAEDYTHNPSGYIDYNGPPLYFCLTRSSGCGTIGMEGGAGLLSVVLLIVWFPLAALADVVRKSK